MDYILELRKYIGHRPILLVGAAILVVDDQNRLLMMRRSDNGCWGIPGGSIEPGETLEAAAKREAFEETGLEIDEMSLFGVFSGPELYYQYPNGDEVYNVGIVYLSRRWRGKIRLNHEHRAWKWFTGHDIPEDVSPPIKAGHRTVQTPGLDICHLSAVLLATISGCAIRLIIASFKASPST